MGGEEETTFNGVDGDPFQDHLLHVVLVGRAAGGRGRGRGRSCKVELTEDLFRFTSSMRETRN
jgi:hypothetical protein